MNRKYILFLAAFLLLINNCFGQSGWTSKFFNNTSTIEKIIKRDSTNYIALCGYSKFFYKSSDAGNTWNCTQDYSFDSVYVLYDGQFLNSLTGWIVGYNPQYYNGVILKTTNGGINWSKQITGFNNDYCSCLSFLNENTGWVGTSSGTAGWLLKTINGGNTWSKQDFPGAHQIRSIKFFDDQNGWILGETGLIAKTTNGGQNWIQKPIPNIPPYYIYNVTLYGNSENECWVLLITGNSGFIYSHFFKTINGGDTWNLMFSYSDGLQTNSHNFWNLNFTSSFTGFANGDFNFIVRTTNSGINWDLLNVAPILGTYPIISSLLTNNNEIFAGGGYSGLGGYRPFNYILKSTDLGVNWNINSKNYEYRFFKTLFLDNNLGFVLSDSGKVFKTSNGGSNWSITLDNRSYFLQDLYFSDSYSGYIITGTNNYYSNKILKSVDFGNSWTEILNSTKPLYSIKFIDNQNGLVGCDSNKLLKTSNSGVNWDLVTLNNFEPCKINSISFINNTTGWVLGHYRGFGFGNYEKNVIWKTTDKGNNWQKTFDSIGFCQNASIKFIDNNNGFKISSEPSRTQKTTNGGSNWFNLVIPNSFNSYSLDFINQNTGWIGGISYSNGNGRGTVYKTTDGQNWTLQFNEYNKIVYSVNAIDENNAWFCGDYSTIYNTTNGGGMIIGINPISNQIPQKLQLSQNYPNPFNPSTKIKFDIPKQSFARLTVYDILGREVAELVNEELKPGTYSFDWDGSNYASGIYFYKLVVGDNTNNGSSFIETKKMVLMK